MEPRKFTCIDCGYQVFWYGEEPKQTLRCATCEWLNGISINEEEKEKLCNWFETFNEDRSDRLRDGEEDG